MRREWPRVRVIRYEIVDMADIPNVKFDDVSSKRFIIFRVAKMAVLVGCAICPSYRKALRFHIPSNIQCKTNPPIVRIHHIDTFLYDGRNASLWVSFLGV